LTQSDTLLDAKVDRREQALLTRLQNKITLNEARDMLHVNRAVARVGEIRGSCRENATMKKNKSAPNMSRRRLRKSACWKLSQQIAENATDAAVQAGFGLSSAGGQSTTRKVT
jgi:hypothetical protein